MNSYELFLIIFSILRYASSDKSKISSDLYRILFEVKLYPISFFFLQKLPLTINIRSSSNLTELVNSHLVLVMKPTEAGLIKVQSRNLQALRSFGIQLHGHRILQLVFNLQFNTVFKNKVLLDFTWLHKKTRNHNYKLENYLQYRSEQFFSVTSVIKIKVLEPTIFKYI